MKKMHASILNFGEERVGTSFAEIDCGFPLSVCSDSHDYLIPVVHSISFKSIDISAFGMRLLAALAPAECCAWRTSASDPRLRIFWLCQAHYLGDKDHYLFYHLLHALCGLGLPCSNPPNQNWSTSSRAMTRNG
jgi:hypothetical protein